MMKFPMYKFPIMPLIPMSALTLLVCTLLFIGLNILLVKIVIDTKIIHQYLQQLFLYRD